MIKLKVFFFCVCILTGYVIAHIDYTPREPVKVEPIRVKLDPIIFIER